MKFFTAISFVLVAGTIAIMTAPCGRGSDRTTATNTGWRSATEDELKSLIPARAPVVKEHIETEFRTASAITDGKGHYVGGVVLITEGYAAEGKYSIFLISQIPLRVESLSLRQGEYAIGWQRQNDDALLVKFYEAQSGKFVGQVEAQRMSHKGRIESFRISPPREKPVIEIGRFGMRYKLPE